MDWRTITDVLHNIQTHSMHITLYRSWLIVLLFITLDTNKDYVV